MKLSQEEKEMIERINNYYLHGKELERHYEKLFELGDGEGNMISKYSEEMNSGTGFKNSKVESSAIRRLILEAKISDVNKEMLIVDMTIKHLQGDEFEVISFLKQGIKMSVIASIMRLKRKKIERIRNSAVRKMITFKMKF